MGHDVNRVKVFVYALSGTLGGLAALVLGFAASPQPRRTSGQGFRAGRYHRCGAGGNLHFRGNRGVWGTVLGLLVVGAVRNGMTLAFINADVQQMIIGGVLTSLGGLYGLIGRLSPGHGREGRWEGNFLRAEAWMRKVSGVRQEVEDLTREGRKRWVT